MELERRVQEENFSCILSYGSVKATKWDGVIISNKMTIENSLLYNTESCQHRYFLVFFSYHHHHHHHHHRTSLLLCQPWPNNIKMTDQWSTMALPPCHDWTCDSAAKDFIMRQHNFDSFLHDPMRWRMSRWPHQLCPFGCWGGNPEVGLPNLFV